MAHIVVIPVYKQEMSKWEEISLRQCCKVLNRHVLCLVTYPELDCSIYNAIAAENGVTLKRENFEVHYFSGIPGYNDLMMSKEFYVRFKAYDFMLIYQLDAYVFRDELDNWCAKDYDYIGAPWFSNCDSHEAGAKLWKVGNGGFSLRKISTHISILSRKLPVLGLQELIHRTESFPLVKRMGSIISHLLGWHNTMSYYVSAYTDFEDFFWCEKIPSLSINYMIPPPIEAVPFSFELSPAYLYEQNGNRLPFGCHAWHKYEYATFWKQFIR